MKKKGITASYGVNNANMERQTEYQQLKVGLLFSQPRMKRTTKEKDYESIEQ